MKASKKKLSLAVVAALNAGVVVGLAGPLAYAQQATTTETQKLEKVEVVGSSIKRSLEDQSLPVQVLTKEDISRSGVQNMEQLIRTIAATASTGSVNGTTLAGQASYGQSSVSLRGLGSVRTLVLLDGQRMTPFAQELATGVDIQSLPISAIERVEVLTDGASSIYGSDAVAGVVNFVLRRNFTGITAGYEYDTPTRSGDGQTNNFWASGGYGDLSKDKFNVTLSYQWKKEDSLIASDRNFSKTANLFPYYVSGATPSGNIEAAWKPGITYSSDPAQARSATNPYGYTTTGYGNPGADSPGCPAMLMYLDPTAKPTKPSTGKRCFFDSAPFVELFPSVKTQSGVGTVDIQITPDSRLYFTGLYTQNKVQEAYQPSPVRGSFLSTDNAFQGSGVDAALLIYPQNPNYPHAWLQSHGLAEMDALGLPLAVSNRAFAAGERTELDTNTQQQWIVGMKGTWLKDWDYDINGQYSQSKSEGTVVAGYFSQLAFAKAWNTVGNTPGSYVDPWAAGGVQNDTLASALSASNYVGPTATAKESLSTFNAKTSGNIYELPAGPVAMAIGFTNMWQNYDVAVPDILGTGDIAGLGGATATQNGSRIVTSGYVEFAIPATKTINLNLSGRVDHYNDLQKDATPVTGKISATWQPYSWGMIRGSVGNGFRAPSMGELHKPVTLGTSEEFVDPLFADNGPIQTNATTGGNPLLEPEKSQQGDLGFVWTPAPNFTARIDWWAIKIDKYIVTPSALAEVNAARAGTFLYAPNEVIFNPDGSVQQVTETLQNAGKATFEGLDFAANWRVPSAWGTWTVDYQGTYYLKADLELSTGVEHNVATLVGPPPDLTPLTLPIAGGVIPRYKQNVSLNWSYGPWGATLVNHLISGYQDAPEQATGNQHHVNTTSIWDLQGTYSAYKYLQFVVGVRNLLDTNPQLYIPTSNLFTYGFDPSVYDPRGRVVYGRVIFSY